MKDIDIIKKCQNGDTQQFSRIYDMYVDRLYVYIYRKTNDESLAQDLLSEVFMSALSRVEHFHIQESSSVQAWLYRIANNKVIDHYRKHAGKESLELGEYQFLSHNIDLQQDIDNKEKLKEILSYIKTLKQEHSQIILLRIWDDLSYKEISEITGKSLDNCKKIVSRGLKDIVNKFMMLCILFLAL